ncbi:hypothetical protein EJB05_02577 [Eragrostis curvula]|uniref:Thioredoxin domain-containing protein n=1 Tax=Eragrostis curvula TaxID=38414 RepID=A0A5J9WSF4_9POAL|nr:hypothetical protein EJB05_02577 [Eragrostis curvula]
MSLTTDVFPHPLAPRWYRIYYIIKTPSDFAKAINANKPVVLMFSADWNEACKVMKKPFRDMSLAKRNQAVFCLVDVDKLNDAVETYRVEALPTFVLMKDRGEKRRVVGARVDDFKNMGNDI